MKLGVCVPYRNREEHLAQFSPRVHKFLEERGIEHKIYFAHQCDDKLFNRGKMKNIAADMAFKDGCDYIVWHDIDMIPEDDSCDYSFNPENPKHLAVRISQTDYNLKYEEYFGGAVLFTKEQVYKTNGYSNDYWDWGMEDDDLFWRCAVNGMADQTYIKPQNEFHIANFDGESSFIEIPQSRSIRFLCNRSHTLSVLVKAHQQEEKIPIYLIGDNERRFWEYPVLRRPGFDYGISYNNSRAFTSMMWNNEKEMQYMWMKRYENLWTWVTLKVDSYNKKIHFYLNGKETDARFGTGVSSPMDYLGDLKRYGSESYFLGTSPSILKTNPNKFFKGQIAEVRMYDRCLTDGEVADIPYYLEESGLQLHYDFNSFNDGLLEDISGNENNGKITNVNFTKENIEIPSTVIPYRRNGKFECLPHQTEGLVDGKWAKGETTARNERRYVLEMQQGKHDWKNDGMSNLTYELLSVEEIGNNSVLINCKC
jgi:hypothetical protein